MTSDGSGVSPPLRCRRPALLWLPLGFVGASIFGALPFSILLSGVSSHYSALFPFVFIVIYPNIAVLCLLSAFLIGGPWALFSRKRQRRSRHSIVLETAVVGLASIPLISFPLLILAGSGRIPTEVFFYQIGEIAFETGWWMFALIELLLVTPFAGIALAWIAFTQPPTPPETRLPSTL